jgi:CRISPR-associated protein Cmr4
MTTEKTSSTTAKALYTQQRFLFMTLDPVHIGAGGYRLGRVDMTITREPGTNLPKIPGTSLAGAARSYAAMRYGKPDATGQHKKMKSGKETCPIIYTFGTATEAGGGQAGTVSIGDAHILFFPVHSMAGPVWVSTKERVSEAWEEQRVSLPQHNGQPIEPSDAGRVVTSLDWDKSLNLGWLLFESTKGLTITPPQNVQPPEWAAIAGRIVLVTPKLFSQIVNSNLEVRTSVSINPETGAAEEGALFTYEAIPRATWLWCDVVEDDYHQPDKRKLWPITKQAKREEKEEEKDGTKQKVVVWHDNAGDPLFPNQNNEPIPGKQWNAPLDVVREALGLIGQLGVGGMGTRGFGRMRCVADWKITAGGAE